MTIYGQHANISNFILWGHFKGMTIACSFCGWTRRFDQSEDRYGFKQPIRLLKKITLDITNDNSGIFIRKEAHEKEWVIELLNARKGYFLPLLHIYDVS